MNEKTATSERPEKSSRSYQRKPSFWQRVAVAVATAVAVVLLRLIWSLYRFEVVGDERFRELKAEGTPVIFAIWHEGILTQGWYVARLLRSGLKGTFLISPSVDGEFGVSILSAFGGERAIRGSSRRSGSAALRGLLTAIRKQGQSIFITLDGSKGPRRYCKPGAVVAARASGAPIVPIGFAASRCWRTRSWDRHVIPKPFAKVVITVGEPYNVPREADPAAVELHRAELENKVNNLIEKAETLVGAGPAPAGRDSEGRGTS